MHAFFATDLTTVDADPDDGRARLTEATIAALGKTYCFGPTFRAEKSKTRRHLTEFWMVEPEMAYATLDDVMSLSERMLSYIAARVLEQRSEELKVLERDTSKLEAIVPPFPRVHYDDAVKSLHEGFEKGALEAKFEWGGDFGSPDETYISSQFDKPVMVHHYPAAIKAFYMARDPERFEEKYATLLTETQRAELKQELSDLTSENKKLKQRLRALRDPGALEREARRLGMVRVGERSYVIENLP